MARLIAIRRATATVIGVITVGAFIAACGGRSSPRHAASSSTANTAQVAFSKCMRAHGVPDFPDPGGPAGHGESSIGGIAIPSTINMQSPAFEAAQADCGKLLPSAPPAGGQQLAALKKQMLHVSQCMRAHGVTGFPDPTSGPVPSGSAGNSIGSGGHVVSLVTPSTIDVNSPAFKKAATTCHFR